MFRPRLRSLALPLRVGSAAFYGALSVSMAMSKKSLVQSTTMRGEAIKPELHDVSFVDVYRSLSRRISSPKMTKLRLSIVEDVINEFDTVGHCSDKEIRGLTSQIRTNFLKTANIKTLPNDFLVNVSCTAEEDLYIIDDELEYHLRQFTRSYIIGSAKTTSQKVRAIQQAILSVVDMRNPTEMYPLARSITRKFYLHVGPTNSGKTYSALQRLKESESGIYCGPLRLLAWEVYERLNEAGIVCDLVTGQDKINAPDANHVSSTVEMLDTSATYEVAVVDEIQLMADSSRGSSFTRALLGVAAKEVHLCGDPSVVDLVRTLVKECNDELEVITYDRLSELEADERPVAKLSDVRKGDCIVTFKRSEIYKIKNQLESSTDMKACVVYGSLPPFIRKSQARLFNDTDSGYHVLIASDAVGLGLNLNIGRMLFSSVSKFDGSRVRPLSVREVRQLAGRAGRFNSDHPKGLYTTLAPFTKEANAEEFLKSQMSIEVPPLTRAAIFPPLEIISRLQKFVPNASFAELLKLCESFSLLNDNYFMSIKPPLIEFAEYLDGFPLSLDDKYYLLGAPFPPLDLEFCRKITDLFLTRLAESKPFRLNLNFNRLESSETLNVRLEKLEMSYKIVDLYVWLSSRFGFIFTEVDSVNSFSNEINEEIQKVLQEIEIDNKNSFGFHKE